MPDFELNAPFPLDTVSLLMVEGGFRLNAGPAEGAPTIEVPVTFQASGLAIPVARKVEILTTLLPNLVNRYVGMFSSMPDSGGVGGVELVGNGYARVAHQTWGNRVVGHVARRHNTTPVQFAELTGDLTARGWGIWDASSGGNLQGFGYIRNAGGTPIIMSFAVTDEPQFLPMELILGIQ